jgi:flavin reductase (DIM6/NTAB) family NADH-FMN oxidoreductase RutF
MELDPATYDGSLYRTLTGTVIPRPIGWISTTSPDGIDNLAPYSFFNVVSVEPPTVMFAPGPRPDGLTDTAANIEKTEEFVVNVVTEEFTAAMNETSATLARGESEFDHADLGRTASTRIEPPRVEGITVAYECELKAMRRVGSAHVLTGEVVHAHLDDAILDSEGKVDVGEVDAVGRLAGSHYDAVESRFRMERPD